MFNHQSIYEGSIITLDQYLYFRPRTLGSFSNDDGDSNENGKKNNRFD